MAKNKKFYQISTSERTAQINIYGNITSWPWEELGGVSAKDIKQEIDDLDVDTIDVYINSYGGEVAEALAIYNALRRHSASVHTYCDGFACSAATIVFAAGDIRTMGSIALLMIHNCMSYLGYANSAEMRKAAEDNDKINQSSIEAYKRITNLSEDEIKEMMDAETWLTAEECKKCGFATDIAEDDEDDEGAQQSAQASVRIAILKNRKTRQEASLDDVLSGINEILTILKDDEPEELEDDDEEDPEEIDEEDTKEDPEDDDPDNTANQKAINFFKNLI